MAELLERRDTAVPAHGSWFPPGVTEVDERAARRSLRDQLAHLESELADLFASAYPREGFQWSVRSRGGPRLLSLRELETLRDELADRLEANRRRLGEQTLAEQERRSMIEDMMLAPAEHRWMRVSNADIGEPGCKHWHVRPRWGLLGMLMNWWRVRISSGCPLAGGRGPRPSPRPAAP